MAQTQVSGTVVSDEDGEPVIGASVLILGTKTGTITNVDGEFHVTMPANSTMLQVSYIGMNTQQVLAKDGMKVTLKSDSKTTLGDVVVTAFGIKRDKKALGYNSQQLTSDQLNVDGTSSLASAIQGKLTGVQIRESSGAPGASAQIVIRGARSFSGNNTPLYVVDGMPIASEPDVSSGDGTMNADFANRSIDINPDDIESINVLKGQAASALYGIRASNGVIMITTKHGKENAGKPTITFSTDLSAQTISRTFHHQDVYAQGNSINAYDPVSSTMTWGPKISDLPNDPKYGGNVTNSYTADGLHQGQYYNPKYAQAGLDGWTTPQTFDNVDDFFKTGFTENANFSISQKKDDLSYSFGLGNTYQTGTIPSTGMDRVTARAAVDLQVSKEWKTGFTVNFSTNNIKSAPTANTGIVNVVYSAPAEYNLKGTPYNVPGDPTEQILFRTPTFNNPYWWAANDEFSQHTTRVFGNAYVEFTPNIHWSSRYNLVFREQAGIDVYTTANKIKAEIGSAYDSSGYIENFGIESGVFNNLFTANFTAKLDEAEKWDLGVLIGNEFNHENARVPDYNGAGFNFYGLPTMSNTTSMLYSHDYKTKRRTIGTFGQLSLSYADQVYLTLTERVDRVSDMPHGHRTFSYPSASLGWIFTELPALKGNHTLSYGKLRASWAQVGMAGGYTDDYMLVPGYGGGMYLYTPIHYPMMGVSSFTPYWVGYDSAMVPQLTKNWEGGVDLNFFDNRVRFEYTLSYQDVTNQIFNVPTSGSTGRQEKNTNAGRMTSLSNELSVNADIIQTKDWGVTLGVNFTQIHNEVKKLAPGVESIMLGGFVEPQIRAQAGYTYPIIFGIGFKRDDQGNLLLHNGLPQGTGSSMPLGECAPDFNMGFNLSAHYKNLSLSATLDWQKGGKMYNGTLLTMNYFGATEESLPYHEGTMVAAGVDDATGQANTVEVSKQDYYMAYNNVTEAGIFDTSYLKLRDVTLNYKLPKLGIFDISVFAFARNVLLWSKLKDFDPESSQGNGNMSGYFERFSIPNSSSFGGGFKINL